MNKIITLAIMMIVTLGFSQSNMNIFKHDGNVLHIPLTDIDSVTYSSLLYAPVLTTTTASNITLTRCTTGGKITDDGGSTIIQKGVCYSTNPNPTIIDHTTINTGTGIGTFAVTLSDLISGTTYYARAFAYNDMGVSYGNQISFTTVSIATCDPTVSDVDGNVYNVVTIGTQCWTKENLKTAHYNDGTNITTGLDSLQWRDSIAAGAYAYYNNDIANNSIYGKLYNWFAVNTGKLCPDGWHVPSDSEWITLVNYLGGDYQGEKIKDTSSLWYPSPNVTNTNSSGFSALPGGMRQLDSQDLYLGFEANFWSSTDPYHGYFYFAAYCYVNNNIIINVSNDAVKQNGYSVRCMKN
ncbi:MAG: hypothetical protein JWN78_3375 [Bacteroidota bacterium]|nr:hypothetical protein [Bacteroidota bacterium]